MKKYVKALSAFLAMLLTAALIPVGMRASAQNYNIVFAPAEPGKSYYYSTENNRLILYPGEIVEITISNPDVAKLKGYRYSADYFSDVADYDNNIVTFTPTDNRYTRMDYFYTYYEVNGSSNFAYCFVYYKACRNVPEGISLDKENLSVNIGETKALTATALPDRSTGTYKDTDFKKVEWKSSDESIAKVDSGGKVTGVSKGTTVITAIGYGKDSDKFTKTCTVTVTNNVSGISLDKTKLNLQTDETAALTATVTPPNADNGTVIWTSSNPGAATVAGGVVTPVSKGSTVITAEAGGFSAQCSVRILEHHSAAESTCSVRGNIEYWEDADGKYYSGKESETPVEDVSTALKSHTLIKTEAHDADCTESGNIAYWKCSVCEKYFGDAEGTSAIEGSDTVVAALGHDMTATAAKAATCVEDGNIAYWTCGRCHKLFSDAEGKTEITDHSGVVTHDENAHSYDLAKPDEIKEPTADADGALLYKCKNAPDDTSHVFTKPIPKGITYTVSDGTYKLSSKKEVSITVNCATADFDPYIYGFFKSLKVNGKELTKDTDYTAESGSVKITLKPSYLEKLSAGKYPVEAVFSNGSVKGTLRISSSGSGSTPGTGDDTKANHLVSGMILFMLSLSTAAYIMYSNKLSAVFSGAGRSSAGTVIDTEETEENTDSTDGTEYAAADASAAVDNGFDDDIDDDISENDEFDEDIDI